MNKAPISKYCGPETGKEKRRCAAAVLSADVRIKLIAKSSATGDLDIPRFRSIAGVRAKHCRHVGRITQIGRLLPNIDSINVPVRTAPTYREMIAG